MSKGRFEACLAETLPHEGGYVDHPADPGGATNMGITQETLARWRGHPVTKTDVRNLTRTEAAQIYEARYWRPIRGDDLPAGIDLSTFDFGVNSGPARSVKQLQRIVGVDQDGVVGPVTLTAAIAADSRQTIKAHCLSRLSFVQSLAIWGTFGRGWSRRIASIEAAALAAVSTKAQLEADADEARNVSAGQGSAAVGVGVTGVGVSVDQAADAFAFPIWAAVIVVALIAAPLIVRSIVNAQREKALRQAAKEA